jgi:hypothetical protein
MKIKATLIAAATLAVGVFSSNAQVYSQNVVGYVNKVTAASQFTMMANQLVTGSDVAQTNCNIQVVLGTNGWTSDPNGVINTTLYYWNIATHLWLNVYYYTDADANNNFGASSGNGWYSGAGVYSTLSLPPGAGFFIKDLSGHSSTNTFIGSVITGTNVYTLNPGFTTFSYIQPVSTNIDMNFPAVSDPNGFYNTAYYHWNGINNWDIFYYYTDADANNNFGASVGTGWYTGDGAKFLANYPQYWPKVGEGFFIHQVTNAPIVYTNIFTIQ